MEIFKKAKIIRLQSHHLKYLFAGQDECEVFQSREISKPNVEWMVEILKDRSAIIRLKSCYDAYLTATEDAFLLGMTGKKALQTKPLHLDSSVEWEVVRGDGRNKVKLRSRNGNFLRANGTVPPWRNSVTHDDPHRSVTPDWFQWEVQILEAISLSPPPPPPPPPIEEEVSLSPVKLPKVDGRIIYFSVSEEMGDISGEWSQVVFKGNSVEALTQRLKEETGISEHILICSRNPINNQLCPLQLQLPPNNTTPMHVVVVRESSKLARKISESATGSGLSLKHRTFSQVTPCDGS